MERNNQQGGCSSPLGGLCGKSEQLCVSVNKIFDSARDKDCLEDLRVHLCDRAQEIVDRATAVRCTNVEVIYANISLDDVPFNRGFFQVTIRYFFCVTLECCVCNGRSEIVKGLCAFDKKIVLFGGEKNVSVFQSDPDNDGFCVDPCKLKCHETSTLPTVTLEVAAPICLDVKLKERCHNFGHCCMSADSIPERVRQRFEGEFIDGIGNNNVYVSIGLFSVIRMERTVQLVLPGSHLVLPEKDSTPANDGCDPCSVFGRMNFPVAEFFPFAQEQGGRRDGCCK